MTVAEHKLDFKHTTDTPYLALTSKLQGVCCEDLGENWPCYNGTTLYVQQHIRQIKYSIYESIAWRHCIYSSVAYTAV